MDITSSLVDFNRAMAGMLERGDSFAVATILRAEGSAPRKAGVKAIIDTGGRICGTIGGGQVEAEAQRRAVEILKTGGPQVFDFHMHGGAVASGEPICGGLLRVLIDPNPQHYCTVFEAAAALSRQERCLLLTSIQQSPDWRIKVELISEQAISNAADFPGEVALRSTLESGEARLFVQEPVNDALPIEVLVEPVTPKPRLLIAGGGHVGQAVALQASLVGFEVIVVEDRPEYANPKLFPEGTTLRCGAFAGEIAAVRFDAGLHVVIVTRGHRHDADALEACIRKPSAFIGMIGSRRKVAILRKEFLDAGRATEAELDRLYAPIGLDIGAVTVTEIAMSIVAQLISVRRRGYSQKKDQTI